MVCYSRTNSFLLVDHESSFNTPVAPTKDLGIVGDWNWDFNNNVFEIIGPAGERELSSVEGGDFEGTLSYNGVLNSGAIFELFFNRDSDNATTGDYKHIFIDDDGTETLKNDLGSFTAMDNKDSSADITIKGGGCAVNSLNISIELNGPITISGEILVAGVDTGTSAGTKVSTTTKSLIYSQGGIDFGAESSEVTLGQVQSFSLDLNNNYERVPNGLGGRTSACYVPGTLGVTGEITMTFQTKTELELFLGGASETQTVFTKQGLIADFNNGVALGSGRLDFYGRFWGIVLETTNLVTPETGPCEATFAYKATTIKDLYMTDQVSSYF